ncbi:MAG TPA: tRNA (adenosine(37)-N6)-threonylcarbamoyltransferase complex dimerization subunit type 1 TsaB, partial [Acidimicrobiales bacterium]|nr:tRNA (adenosine(37)-N6)-threonylcarbamoyltransferase complex dimerization subunit type 1 TsaB [Acidimicrobiales bacterium]
LVAGRRHAETLMPAIETLCVRAGLQPRDLEGVAVDVGPGLFTGLRVGLAAARAMSAALGVPAAGVTSLEALAYPHRRRPGLVASVVDARRAEVYWALYRGYGQGAQVALKAPAVGDPEEVAETLAGQSRAHREKILAIGDGAWRYAEVFESRGLAVSGPDERWPSPLAVAELGLARIAAAGPVGLPPPAPLYLRQADVRVGWESVSGRTVEQSG